MADRKKEEGPGSAYKQGLYEESATAQDTIGHVRWDMEGNEWIYTKNSTVALLASELVASTTTTFTREATVTVAHPIGTTVLTVTGTATADQFAGGKLIVDNTTGLGETYKVIGNTATASSVFQVTLATGLITAWVAATTDVVLVECPYNGVIQNPVDCQQLAVGVTQRPVTASYYFWLLKDGWGGLKLDNAAGTVGLEFDEKWVYSSLNHAGFGFVVTPAETDVNYGRQIVGLVAEEYDVVNNRATLCRIKL